MRVIPVVVVVLYMSDDGDNNKGKQRKLFLVANDENKRTARAE